jgi:hypothetical protein
MSIHDLIQQRLNENKLRYLRPILDSDPVERTLLVSIEIYSALEGPWQNIEMERRCFVLRADLESFVKGETIGMCLTAHAHKTAYMGRLDKPKDEVWDIRCRDPSPAFRIFGRFACADTFVALKLRPRSVEVEWSSERPLGDRNSIQWQIAILETQNAWEDLFPYCNPVHGEDLNVYVTNNRFLI